MRKLLNTNRNIVSLTLLSVAIVLSYLPLFTNAFVEWDDYYYITHNELITSFSPAHIWTWFTQPFRGLYQPLILLSYAINYALDGLNPTVFHTTNLALHLANSFLVYYFVSRLTKTHFIALLTAFLFALHPMHVESVAWATERKDTLYVLFFLIGLLSYQSYILHKSKKYYNRIYVFFILSLMSKGSAITFPFVLVLIDYLTKRGWYKKKILWEKMPFFILAFAYGLMTFYMHHRWGAAQNHTTLTSIERILFTAYAFTLYLYKLVIPFRLSAFYPFPYSESGGFPPSYIWYWLSYAGYFGLLIYAFFRQRILFFGMAFFLSIGLFLLTVGVPIIIADRFTYLPSIGLFIVFSYYLQRLYIRLNIHKALFQWLIISPLLIVFAFLSFQQTKSWKNPFALWDTTYRNAYKNEYILTKRGSALLAMEKYDEAEADLNEAITINAKHTKAYSYRGFLYSKEERYKKAKKDFLKVLQNDSTNSFAWNSLGFIEYKLGNFESAKGYLSKILQTDSLNFDANKNMGLVLFSQNKMIEACIYLHKALRLQREDSDAETISELVQKSKLACKEINP